MSAPNFTGSSTTNYVWTATDNAGNGAWAAATGGTGITALTGDGTATGPGAVALTLATVNSNTGSYGDGLHIPQFTVNGKGLITSVTNIAIPTDTLRLSQYGTGIPILSSNLAGTIFFHRSFENSAFGVWGLNSDSSIFIQESNIAGIVADGSTDDSAAVAVRVAAGGVVRFPYQKTIFLSGPIAISKSNTIIDLNGSTIKISSSNANFGLGVFYTNNTTAAFTDASPTASMTKGQNWVKYSGFASTSLGQIIQLSSTATWFSPYHYGHLAVIEGYHNDTIWTNIAADTTFTVGNIHSYTALNGIKITNGTINMNGNTVGVGVNLSNTINSVIDKIILHGTGAEIGLEVLNSFNAIISQNRIDSLTNTVGSTAYGINVCGHNIKVEKNNVVNCKHDITASASQYTSTDILYYQNICVTTTAALAGIGINIDMHGNVHGDIDGNIVSTIGSTGIQVRDKLINVKNNKVFLDNTTAGATTLKAIDFLEAYRGESVISNNEVWIKAG